MQIDKKGRIIIGAGDAMKSKAKATPPKNWIEYMCSQCGKREVKSVKLGKPEPGKCPKSPSGRAHRWVKNRMF